LCTLTIAISCMAQQSTGNGSSSAIQVSPADADKILIERIVPQYPEAGIANQIQNNEILNLQIDEQGNIADAQIKSGHPLFGPASLDAVKQWKYRPYLVNDSPVRFETTALIAYRFWGSNNIPSIKEPSVSVVVMSSLDGAPNNSKLLQIGSNQ